MTESESPKIGAPIVESTSKKRRGLKIIVGLLVLLAVAVGGYFAIPTPLDKEMVKNHLDQISATLAAASGPAGQATFTYADVEIIGGFFSKTAKIVSPKLEMMELPVNAKRTISTPAIYFTVESPRLATYNLTLKDPVLVEGADYKTEVSMEGELIYRADTDNQGDEQLIEHALTLPKKFTVKDMKEGSTVQPFHITYDATPAITLKTSSKEGVLAASLKGSNVDMQQEGAGGSVIIGSLDADYAVTDADNKRKTTVDAQIKDLKSTYEAMPYGSFHLALSGEMNIPADANVYGAVIPAGGDIRITQLNLGTEKFGLEVSGELKGVKEDPVMPVGAISVNLRSFDFILAELKKNGLIAEQQEKMLDAAVSKVTGKPLSENQNLSFSITREEGKAVQIGNTDFPTMLAILLTGQEPPPAPAEEITPDINPSIPSSEQPKAEDGKKE